MKYIILIYGNEAENAKMSAETGKKVMQEYFAYTAALQQAKVMLEGAPLESISTATTLRVRNDKTLTTDGPFAETKEQLGGFYMIECASLDEALKWGAKCPGAMYGSVEVRPIRQIPGM